jgi:molybdate transport system permease protein
VSLTAAEWEAVRLSLLVATWATLGSLPFAVLVAWLLSRTRIPGRVAIDVLVHLSLVLPPVVVGYLLLVTFGARAPLGAWLASTFGIHLAFTTQGAALAAAVMAFPLMVRAMRISLDNVDGGLEAAARTLGASGLDTFLSVTLPLMLPGILAGMAIAFASALGNFGATITFVGNIEGITRTLPLAIYTATQMVDGEAIALRLVVVSLVLAVALLVLSEWIARRAARYVAGRG